MKRSRGGFTLAEVLIALAIFSLVMSAVYSFWIHGMRIFRRGTDRLDGLRTGMVALARLADDVRGAGDRIQADTDLPPGPIARNNRLTFSRRERDGTEREMVIRFDPQTRRITWRRGPERGIIASGVLGVDFRLQTWPLPGDSGWMPAVSILVILAVEGEPMTFRTLAVPRRAAHVLRDPAWLELDAQDAVELSF